MEPNERFFHSECEAGVQRECFARPVERTAQALELGFNGCVVLLLPVPDEVDELFASEIMACQTLVFG